MPRPDLTDDGAVAVRDYDDARTAPTLHSIDKQLALLTAEQKRSYASVDRRFDNLESQVRDFGSQYATKVDLAEAVKKIEKVEVKHEKFVDKVYSYGKAIILLFLAALASVVFKAGLIH